MRATCVSRGLKLSLDRVPTDELLVEDRDLAVRTSVSGRSLAIAAASSGKRRVWSTAVRLISRKAAPSL
jgi:hypothetical protein